ncbi:Exocyst complex component EXO84A [Capsicum baccatum]|uniref:Exocyst complex component EXO84A n=1 Tax=Capsicum baccatum TaxID=33114 RepID=A0A2G2VSZ4_CAPBA|nr:Exocyst complex component EXO84A [Capsicum baccatum]
MMDGGSFSSSIGDSIDFDEKDLSLSDKLKVFKSSAFNPDSYVTNRCRHMSEKEIRHLCKYLTDLRKASAEEMRKSVYANYAAFIRTSREISNLEGQLIALRNLLSTRAAIVHGLAEGINIDSLSSSEGSIQDDRYNQCNSDTINTESWLGQFVEKLEVLLAERRVDEVLDVLDEGEHMANDSRSKQTLTPPTLLSLQKVITEQKQKLAAELAEASFQSSVSAAELRFAVRALKRLGDGPRAHTLMLSYHQQKLHGNMQGIRPSGTSHGVAYSAGLSQLVFSTIAQATSDSLALFDDEPSYSSELVTWAVNQTQNFSHLIKRFVIASPAASGCLRPVAESVHISLGHCSLLEARGLTLSPVLVKIFRPCVEQALYANIKRIEQCTAAHAAVDDWSPTYPPTVSRSLGTASLAGVIASQPKLSSSAHRFNTMVQLGRRQIIPITKNMTEFVFEVRPEISLPEDLAQQIWEGHRIMGIETMVIEHEKGEVHSDYREWFKEQSSPPVRPERSVKGPIDQEAAIRIGIERAMREHHEANQVLREELEHARAKIDEQQREFSEEKAKSAAIEVTLRGKIKFATTRGSHVAELTASRRQQLPEVEKNMQEEFDRERSQWIRERGILREQLEVVSAHEQRAREMVDFRD